MEALTPWHLLAIVIAFVVLFGYRKLPDASRSLGRSLRIFRSEMRELSADNMPPSPAPGGGPAEPVPPVAEATPQVDAEQWEAEARLAEAEAAALRARARAHGVGGDTKN